MSRKKLVADGYTVSQVGPGRWTMTAPDGCTLNCGDEAGAWEAAQTHSRWEGVEDGCSECGRAYGTSGDGWNGLCPECADRAEGEAA